MRALLPFWYRLSVRGSRSSTSYARHAIRRSLAAGETDLLSVRSNAKMVEQTMTDLVAGDPVEMEPVETCDLCGGSETGIWEIYERFGLIFNVVKCRSCGLAYVSPRPTARSIGGFYNSEYTSLHGHYVQPRWMTYVTPLLRRLLRARYGSSPVRRLLARAVLPWEYKWRRILAVNHLEEIDRIGRVLDVGCGHGHWLSIVRRWGFDCFGCEPDPVGARAAASSGLEVVQHDLPGAGYASDQFDVVRFSHVLEHVHSPTVVLSEAVRVTRPGGIVVVIVPNHEGLVAQAFRHIEDVPRHLFAFSPATLRRYFEKVGLEIVTLQTVTEHRSELYGKFASPATDALRAAGASADAVASVQAFFGPANRRRDREYAATTDLADSLGLGICVIAVGRRPA